MWFRFEASNITTSYCRYLRPTHGYPTSASHDRTEGHLAFNAFAWLHSTIRGLINVHFQRRTFPIMRHHGRPYLPHVISHAVAPLHRHLGASIHLSPADPDKHRGTIPVEIAQIYNLN